MPTPALSAAKINAILDAKSRGLTNAQIAKETKTAVGTVSKVLQGYGKNTDKTMPGEVDMPVDGRGDENGDTVVITTKPLSVADMVKLFKVDEKRWVCTNFKTNIWQGFYKASKITHRTAQGTNTQASHQKVALFQTTCSWKRVMTETMELALVELMRECVRPLPKPRLAPMKRGVDKVAGPGALAVWGLWDAHLGMYAWHAEVGESMDLTKAVSRVTNSLDDMGQMLVAWPQKIEKIVMPIGNDFMHYDNARQRTTYGEHHLDADGRYGKVFQAGLKCLIYSVERALDVCEDIEVIFVPGNHDMHSGYALCVALSQRFFNDPRVKFNLSPNPRKRIIHGEVLIALDHGQKATPVQLARIISEENRDVWSQCRFREVHVGHIHQSRAREYESVTPTNGVKVRVNPALCNIDMYHHESGLIGEPVKSVEVQLYQRTGPSGMLVAWARDDHSEAIKDVKLA
jgi:hypothetical protein